jgi:hypothetical protein
VTKGVSSKQQREDRLRLRRKRLLDASGALQGAKEPAPRPPAHRYPVTRASLGDRQAVAPLGRGDK